MSADDAPPPPGEGTAGEAPGAVVRADELHAAVDAVAAALHAYVDSATGAAAEFGAGLVGEDPRVGAAQDVVDARQDELDAALGEVLWGPSADDEDDEDDALAADTFTLDLVVRATPGGPRLDDVLERLDAWGHEVRERLVGAGYDVPEWGVGRTFGDDEELDEEDQG